MSVSRNGPHELLVLLMAGLWSATLTGCLDAPVVKCSDGSLCPAHMACDLAHQGCVLPEQVDACATKADGSACTYRGVGSGACYEHVCLPSGCGNGILDQGEACDDGNHLHGDGCSADCRSNETCGNKVVDVVVGESCERITPADDAWCRADCVSVRCGDGVLDEDAFELCDEGDKNSAAPDAACRPNCQPRRCGDGIQDKGETCDDGNLLNGDGCSYDCKSREICGNAYTDVSQGELCDDGNLRSHDGCSSRCRSESPVWRNLSSDIIQLGENFAYDATRDTTITFAFARTLELHGTGWQQRSAQHVPSIAYDAGEAWDSARRRVVLFGGTDGDSGPKNETWEWDGQDWQRRIPASSTPSARQAPGLVYDLVRQKTVLFGGMQGPNWLSDTWEWDGNDWQRIAASGGPPQGSAACYDPVLGKVVAFDGLKLRYLEGSAWKAVAAALPSSEEAGTRSLVFDAVRGHLVYRTPGNASDAFYKLFEWTGKAWQPFAGPAGPVDPNAMLIYRGARRRLGLVTGSLLWEWDGSAWVWGYTNYAPSQRRNSAMVYDPLRGSTLLFGGGVYDENHNVNSLSDTWNWDGATWQNWLPSTTPPARAVHSMVYDPVAQNVMMFGGGAVFDTTKPLLGDTWIWNGGDWSEVHPSKSPSPRKEYGMTYDAAHKQVVLFGGGNFWSGLFKNDLWTWDGHDWTEHKPTEKPSARTLHGLSYDPIRRMVLMMSGIDDGTEGSQSFTWTWDGAHWAKAAIPTVANRYYFAMPYDPNRKATFMMSGEFVDNVHSWSLPAVPADQPLQPWEPVPLPFSRDPVVSGANAVYEPLQGRIMVLASVSEKPIWELSYRAQGEADEVCSYGFDIDGDGLAGCADPDCWGYCTPLCPPGTECDQKLSRCGDGMCNDALETCRLCPEDCSCDALCGDFFCDEGETSASCPGDCTHPLKTLPSTSH